MKLGQLNARIMVLLQSSTNWLSKSLSTSIAVCYVSCSDKGLCGSSIKVTCEKYAIGVHHFLLAGCHHGAKVDFSKRRLVGIGHSLGGVAMSVLPFELESAVNCD